MEKNYNEIARLRRHFASLSDRAVPTDSCIEAGRIFDAARGLAPAAECREVADHAAECPVCAEGWRLAIAIDYPDVPVPTPAPKPRFQQASSWMMAVAALLLLAVVGGNVFFSAFQPQPHNRALLGAPLTIKLDQDAFSPEGLALRWEVSPESASTDLTYRVEIKTRDSLQDVYSRWGIEDQALRVTAEDLGDLDSDAALVWQVQAVSSAGVVSTSPARLLRLR